MRNAAVLLVAMVATVVLGTPTVPRAQAPATTREVPPQDFPDPAALVRALKQTPGCLGAELGRAESGKVLIFAWFENKQGLVNWYTGAAHRQRMKEYFGLEPSRTPLQNVPDNGAPILVIASFTLADRARFKETRLPLSQLAIELYQPLAGGIDAGGRLAPDALKVPKMRHYAPGEK